MSTWTLGANDVSEETRSFREKLASKDSQIAAQEDKIHRQAADREELQERLNEALHKLSFEAGRAIELEADLRRRSEDLQNERITSENARNALRNALEKQKESSRELRDLEGTLDQLSRTSDEHKAHWAKAEKEKTTLESRVNELEVQLRPVSHPAPAFTPGRRIPKARSSSLSNIRINTLEQDLTGLRSQLVNKGTEVDTMSQKLSRALQDRNKAENERIAMEQKWHVQIESLQAALDEKEEELVFLREQLGDGSREDELLKRIEEDDARIAALEIMLRDTDDSKEYKEKIRRLEINFNEERQQRKQIEVRCLELSGEKDDALKALGEAQQEAANLASELEERQLRDEYFEERASKSLHTCEGPTPDDPQPQADTISHLEKLLVAVDRLRVERDGLRRDLSFLESESRFTIEALERKLASSSVSVYSDIEPTVKTLDQMKHEMEELHAHLHEVTEDYTTKLNWKNNEIYRLGLCLEGLAVAFSRMTSLEHSSPSAVAFPEAQGSMDLLEEKYEATVLCLEAMTSQRDDLQGQLQAKDAEWEKEIRLAQHDIDELKKAVVELNAHIDHVESERDSVSLQVTNLTSDLLNAQDELANAETRYTNLQFNQLSNMTSNEATRTLREHIEELEARVMRRTEQIGIHQHDIRRLETNLRLQEERLSEMMAELEMTAAQKDAMVEDCADAREARDEALVRIEALEEELEAGNENEQLVTELIAVVVDTAARARNAIQCTRGSATHREGALKTTIARLDTQIGEIQQKNDLSIRSLLQQLEELETRLKDYDTTHVNNENNEKQIIELKLRHAEAIKLLQQRLADSERALEDLQIRYKSAEVDHQNTLEDTTSLIKELEHQLEMTKKCVDDLEESHSKTEQGHVERVVELERELKQSSQDYQTLLQASDTTEKEMRRLETVVEQMKGDHEHLMANVRDEHLGSQRNMENQLQTLQQEVEENVRLLDNAKAEAAHLSVRLQEETAGRVMEREQYDLALQSMTQQSERMAEQLHGMQRDLTDIQSTVQLAECQVRTTEDEKTILQQDITTLGAEIQKLKSINRYLESQSKESEHVAITLKEDVEHLRLELAHAEKACKAAEVNLSLQNAQHKRENSELQRQVTNLQRIPNFETALRELEERNNEMEELLRSKCGEIEANDDRVLEMFKEKKKLLNKVESLNRKVQNLQAKLAAAKASNAQQSAPQSQESQIASSSSSNTDRTPSSIGVPESRPRAVTIAQTPQPSRVLPARTTSIRNPPQRIVSGPSSLPRPKTPERSRTPVFKARTPERLEVDRIPENTLIGKKRAAPDDFDAVENIPAHAFLADGKDAENRTPRVRRVLSSLQSSFTPNRSSNRPLPSPKRPEIIPLGTAHMSDVTNSPFALPLAPMSSAKPSKRSWLGKIRGASQVDKPTSNTRMFVGTS